MSHTPEPVRLHGIDGHIVDAGANASYFEAPLHDDALRALTIAARQHALVDLIRGETHSRAVVRRCWYDIERLSVLVQFLEDGAVPD